MGSTAQDKYDREERLFENSDDVPDADREAIMDFVESVGLAITTRRQYLLRLRTLSERADSPLTEMTRQDMQQLLDAMSSGSHPDVKDDGINVHPHVTVLSKFSSKTGTPFEWGEIDFEKSSGRDLDGDDLLYQDDVDAIFAACGMDVRYKALIAWGLASGQRIDAL